MFEGGIYSKILYTETGKYHIIFLVGGVKKRDNSLNHNHSILLKQFLMIMIGIFLR